MSKLIRMSAVALALAGGLMLSMPVERAMAQSAGLYVNAVDLDIAPDQMDAFLAAIKENGAASVKEPGCQRVQHHGAGRQAEPRVPVRGL